MNSSHSVTPPLSKLSPSTLERETGAAVNGGEVHLGSVEGKPSDESAYEPDGKESINVDQGSIKSDSGLLEGTPALLRTTRKRVPIQYASENDDDDNEDNGNDGKEEDSAAMKEKTTPDTQRKRQPVRGNYSTQHLMTNSQSKLVRANLTAILSSSFAWDCLSPAQQQHLLQMLPDHARPASPELHGPHMPKPNHLRSHLKSSAAFQADVRFFQEDLAAGRYEPQWLRNAEKAMQERADGDFDNWKEAHREAFWGQKQKVAWNAVAGESSVHDLLTLSAAGLFQVGDIWRLERNTRPVKGEEGVQIEKEATITAIAQDYSLSFNFPPGKNKFSSPANGEDLHVTGVSGPSQLIKAMLEEDGRTTTLRLANAWRVLRCVRKNQDMGSLWDVRELYHQQRRSS